MKDLNSLSLAYRFVSPEYIARKVAAPLLSVLQQESEPAGQARWLA
jgi:hypothetical protein